MHTPVFPCLPFSFPFLCSVHLCRELPVHHLPTPLCLPPIALHSARALGYQQLLSVLYSGVLCLSNIFGVWKEKWEAWHLNLSPRGLYPLTGLEADLAMPGNTHRLHTTPGHCLPAIAVCFLLLRLPDGCFPTATNSYCYAPLRWVEDAFCSVIWVSCTFPCLRLLYCYAILPPFLYTLYCSLHLLPPVKLLPTTLTQAAGRSPYHPLFLR